MPDPTPTPAPAAGSTETPAPPPEGGPTSGLSAEQYQKEIERLRRENAGHRTKAKEAADALAAREADEAKKRGEWEGLYTKSEAEKKALADKVAAYEAKEASAREKATVRLAEITKEWTPEEKAVYLRESLPVEERLEVAEARNKERTAKTQPKAPGYRPGAEPPGPVKLMSREEFERHKAAFRAPTGE